MRVGHHRDQRAVGGGGDSARRLARINEFRVGRRALGKGPRASRSSAPRTAKAPAPARARGRRGRRRRDRGRAASPNASRQPRQRIGRLLAAIAPLDAPVGAVPRDDGERAGAFGGRKRRQRLAVARVENLDAPLDPPAAALAELGAERDDAAQRRPAPGVERAARLRERPPFELAAADRAVKPPEGRTTIRAPASRGLDPSVSTRLTSAAEPSASIDSMRRRNGCMARLMGTTRSTSRLAPRATSEVSPFMQLQATPLRATSRKRSRSGAMRSASFDRSIHGPLPPLLPVSTHLPA